MQVNTLVPSFIANAYSKSETHGRFTAVALQADISGFTNLTNTIMAQNRETGGEIVENLMRGIFNPLIDQVHEYGGFVAMFAGDAFTAFFPYNDHNNSDDPNHDSGSHHQDTQRDAAHRAITAAWRMQQTISKLASDAHSTNFQFGMKIGIGSGEIDWRIFPATAPQDIAIHAIRSVYTFVGDGLNSALSALDQAERENIICSSEIQEQTTPFARFTEMVRGQKTYFYLTELQSEATSYQAKTADHAEDTVSDQRFIPFVPTTLQEKRATGEFRQVVSLFIGLNTQVSDLAELEPFTKLIYRLQTLYGGYLNALRFGDKGGVAVMFWGAPISLERDVQLATQFAYRLQQESDLTLRMGLSYRWLYSGLIGADGRQDYTCYGGGTSFAARLMTSAENGQVLLDSTAAQRISAQFELTALGERPMKGFDQPQEVYLLEQRKSDVIGPHYQQSFVGRQQELVQLGRFVAQQFGRDQTSLFTLRGDAGSGKSRLLHEFQQQLVTETWERPPQWCLCQADELVQSDLNAVRYYLQRHFDQSPEASDEANKATFSTRFSTLLDTPQFSSITGDLEKARSFIGSVLGLYWPDSLYSRFPPQQRQGEINRSLALFFKTFRLLAPVVIQIEDAHWLDESSTKLFIQLVEDAEPIDEQRLHSLVLIQTTRHIHKIDGGLSSNLRKDLEQAEILVGQLPSENAAEFVNQLLDQPASASLLKLLQERTNGNPFFLEQTVLYWQEVGLLYVENGETKAKQDAQEIASDIRAVLLARIDRLLPNVRDTVQTASVLGHEFSSNVLRWMLKHDPKIDDHITQATESSIWLQFQELRYLFKHALLRDVAYQMQLQLRRRNLHQVALDGMEALYQADLTPYFGELAYHAEQSNQMGKALTYLTKAGDAASATYQNESALAYYGRGLNYLDLESDESRSYGNELISLATRYAKTLHFLNRFTEVPAALKEAAKLAQELRLTTQVCTLLLTYANNHLWRGEYLLATSYAQHALAIATELEDNSNKSKSLYELGKVFWFQGHYDKAMIYAKQAVATIADTKDSKVEQELRADLYNFWALSELFIGSYANALEGFEKALQIERSIKREAHVANILQNLGCVYQEMGDYESAINYHEQAVKLLDLFDIKQLWVRVMTNLGYTSAKLGRAEGMVYLDQSIKASTDFELDYDTAASYLFMGEIYFDQGEYEKAIVACHESHQVAKKITNKDFILQNQLLMAQIKIKQQNTAEALTILESIDRTELNTGQQGDVHYTSWLVTGHENDATAALTHYQKIVADSPKITYTERIAELQARSTRKE